MSSDCKLNIALIGNSENLITWGTILSRKGLTLSGIYMPAHWAALVSVLLLGCPAYSTGLETAESGELLFIEADFFATWEETEKQQILQVKGPRAIVFVHFNGAVQAEKSDEEKLDKVSQQLVSRANIANKYLDNCEFYDLQLYGSLPLIGKDVLRVDEVCAGRPHEPNPSEDYVLSCAGVTFVLRPWQDEHSQEAGIGRIIETVLG